ncbi:MarR family transcriptional regulator [Bacillus sp. DJP31]|uniref:MarR family transcriptional regulator n=1 Tax=Bacillus sp. DJP31 TaxID=3409789 RepID=UPI003BB79E5A
MDQALLHVMINHWRGMYKVLESDWQAVAKETGVTPAELHVLWILSLEVQATMSRIAELGLWDLSTVAQMINRLKKKEMIKTKKKNKDRRISYCELTPLGKEKAEESKAHSYKFLDYLKEQEDKNNDISIIEQLRDFQVKFNRHFHGKDFVDWVDETAKQLP